MQVLQAGSHRLLFLELERDLMTKIAREAGFDVDVSESVRGITLDLRARDRQAPLLLFDAADPGNLGWFSRCHFYVDGRSGTVLQTPVSLANIRAGDGRPVPDALRVHIQKELPANFKLPGRQPVNEQVVYAVLYNLLNALLNVGVGLCGKGSVEPLAGRVDTFGPRS